MIALVLLCTLLGVGSCSNILFIPSFISPSHKLSMVPWADALAFNGHHVLMWEPVSTSNKYMTKVAHIDQFTVPYPRHKFMGEFLNDMLVYQNTSVEPHPLWARTTNVPGIESVLNVMVGFFCKRILTGEDNLWKSKVEPILRQHWDLVILDELFNPCGLIVAQRLRKLYPTQVVMYVSTNRMTPYGSKYSGVPQPPSYIPNMGMLQMLSDRMTFFERVHSQALNFVGMFVAFPLNWFQSFYLRSDHTKDIGDIPAVTRNPALLFNNYNMLTNVPHPILPHIIHIGGLHLPQKQSTQLVDPFKTAVEQPSNRGTIVIAFGHTLPMEKAPRYLAAPILDTAHKFAEQGHVVYVQYHGNDSLKYPLLKFVKWMPLYQLLAHNRTVALVNHGGGNTIAELMATGKPALLLPMNAEQPDGSAGAARLGLAIAIPKLHITHASVDAALTALINQPTYALRAKHVSNMVHHNIITPEQQAPFWTQFALRHNNYEQFRRLPKWITQPGLINAIVYLSLDVIAVVLFSTTLAGYITVMTVYNLFIKCRE